MAKKEKTVSSVFFNGILNENPTLRLVLGICPTLASTTSASNAVGMGLALADLATQFANGDKTLVNVTAEKAVAKVTNKK